MFDMVFIYFNFELHWKNLKYIKRYAQNVRFRKPFSFRSSNCYTKTIKSKRWRFSFLFICSKKKLVHKNDTFIHGFIKIFLN